MSRKDKLLKRILTLPKNFTYDEAVSLLASFKFFEIKTGKTSGSAVRFKNDEFPYVPVVFHKPHPGNELKVYVLRIIITALIKCDLIEEETENNENEERNDTE